MSAPPIGLNLGVRETADGRLAFHLRLPEVPEHAGLENSIARDPAEAPRGMKVLNRILKRDPRGDRSGPVGRNRLNRFWLFAIVVVSASCLGLAYGLTSTGPKRDSHHEHELYADDDFESVEPAPTDRRPARSRQRPQVRPAHVSATTDESPVSDSPAAGSESPADGIVQTATWHTSQTSQSARNRAVWLEGTILPDDAQSP